MYHMKYLLIGFIALIVIACGNSKTGTSVGTEGSGDAASNVRIEQLIEQIDDEPNNLQWRYQLAGEYEKLGRNLEALKTYEGALAIDPSRSDLKYSYAELALLLGDRKKAYQAYKEILQGLDSQQYLDRITKKFVDVYSVNSLIATDEPEAYANYSSDGNKIIYQSFRGDNWDIFEYNIASQVTNQLTVDPAHEENPVYSPDGKYIAYTSTRDDHRNVDYNQKLRDIYIQDLSNKRETNLTTNSSNDWKPRYSRDGNFIVFVSERNDLRDIVVTDLFSNVFIMEANGSFQLQLTKGEQNDGGPVMVGGETDPIYFDSNRSGDFAIYKMNGDGTDQKQITLNSGSNDVSPDVSSDGTKIVFFSDRDGNYEIYMMNSDGTNEQRLTSNPADDVNPIFSPDGNKILFHSNRFGNFDIFEIELSKKEQALPLHEVIAKIDEALSKL